MAYPKDEELQGGAPISTPQPTTDDQGLTRGGHLGYTDQETYDDGIDDWEGEGPNEEGPHLPDYQREELDNEPPTPDDGIHMDEDEFYGDEPSQGTYGTRFRTEAPQEDYNDRMAREDFEAKYGKPMGLGGPKEEPEEGPLDKWSQDATDWDDDRTRTTHTKEHSEAISEQRELFKGMLDEDDEDEMVSTWDLMGRAVQNNDLVTGVSWALEDVYNKFTDPEMEKVDPDFDPMEFEDKFKHLSFSDRTKFVNAKNELQFKEALARQALVDENNAVWANASTSQYIFAGGVSMVTEGLVGVAAGNALGLAAKGMGLASKLTAAQRVQQYANITLNSRYQGAINQVVAGTVGGAAEGAFVYSQGVISAQEAVLYPIMGASLGGAAGAALPYSFGGVTRPDPRIDPVMSRVEVNEAAAAHVHAKIVEDHGGEVTLGGARVSSPDLDAEVALQRAQFRRDNPGVSDDIVMKMVPDKGQHPMSAALKDVAGEDMDAPSPRQVLFERHTVMAKREKGFGEAATRNFEADSKLLRKGFLPTFKNAKKLGKVFQRQGYALEKRTKMFLIDGEDAHKFARDSGGVRRGYTSLEQATKAANGAKVVEVDVPAGSKVIQGGTLDSNAGVPDEFLIGQGKVHRGAGDKWSWRPEKDLSRERPHILRAKTPEGKYLHPDQIMRHNKLMDTLDPELDWAHIRSPGSGVGANIVVDDSKFYNLHHTTDAKEHMQYGGEFGAEKPKGWREWLTPVTIVGYMENAYSAQIRNLTGDIAGGAIDMSRKDTNKGLFTVGGSDLSGMRNNAHFAKIGELENELIVDFTRDARERGIKLPVMGINRDEVIGDYLHRYLLHQYEKKAIPEELRMPSLEKAAEKINKMYAEQLKDAQDPSRAVGLPPGTLQAVAGTEGIPTRDGYIPFVIDNGKVAHLESQFGGSGFLAQSFTNIFYNQARALADDIGRQSLDNEMFETMGQLVAQAHLMSKHGLDFEGVPVGRGNTADTVVEVLTNAGIDDESLIARAREAFAIFDELKVPPASKFFKERMKIPMLQPIRVRLDHGGFTEITMQQMTNSNVLHSTRNYMKHTNGLVALATTPVRNVEGKPMMKTVPVIDEATGLPMKDADGNPVTEIKQRMYNSMAEVNNKIKAIEKEYAEKFPAGLPFKARQELAAVKEMFNTVLNHSKFNPAIGAQLALDLATTATMGGGHWAALLDLPNILANLGVEQSASVLTNKLSKLPNTIMNTAKFLSTGKFQEINEDVATRWLMEATGMGMSTRGAKDRSTHSWNNARFADKYVGAPAQAIAYGTWAARRSSEFILKTGLLPMTDAMHRMALEGNMGILVKYAKKYGKAEKIPYNELQKLQKWRISIQDIDDILDMLNSDAFEYKKQAFGPDKITKIHHGKLNQQAAKKLQMAMSAAINQKQVMTAASGTRILGLEKGYAPIMMQLLSFSVASAPQLLRNSAQTFGENAYDLATGKYGGRYEATKSMAKNAAAFAVIIAGAAVVENLKSEWKMLTWEDEAREGHRRNNYNPKQLLYKGFEKSGVPAVIPTLYDMVLAPAINAPNWAGYKDYDSKRTGFAGILENAIFENPVAGLANKTDKMFGAMGKLAQGELTQKNVADALSMTNSYLLHDTLRLSMSMLGVKSGVDYDPVESDPVKGTTEALGKTLGKSKTVKEFSKAWDYWTGD